MTGEALTDELEKLKLDYEQTNETFRMLADIRFKLLAFVPTISGVGVTLAAQATDHETGLALGLIGLVVTLGIIIYELRNTQIYDATVHRAKWLEVSLGMRLCTKNMKAGGLFNERPARANTRGEHSPVARSRSCSCVCCRRRRLDLPHRRIAFSPGRLSWLRRFAAYGSGPRRPVRLGLPAARAWR